MDWPAATSGFDAGGPTLGYFRSHVLDHAMRWKGCLRNAEDMVPRARQRKRTAISCRSNQAHVKEQPASLYRDRRLVEGYPDLSRLSLETFQAALAVRPDERPLVEMIVTSLDALIDIDQHRN